MRKGQIHRWQFIGKTPCGLKITDSIKTNVGYCLDEAVTCERCKRARTRISILSDDWNGQSEGHPDKRTFILRTG